MSVLIKGVDMPKMPDHIEQGIIVPYIDVRIFADGTAVTSKNESPYYKQFTAVPVPTPHGDLIERKTAYESLLNGMVMTGYQSKA